MKKYILMLLVSLVSISSWGSKAFPVPFIVRQSDNTEVTIRLYGDEDFHYYATLDGALLVPVGNDYYIAAVGDDGTLTATIQLAHDEDQRSDIEKQLIAAQNKDAFFSKSNISKRSSRKRVPVATGEPAYVPHTGSPKIAVILVNYADSAFTIKKPYYAFNEFFNKDSNTSFTKYGNYNHINYGSVRQYFSDMSNGEYTPDFVVKGPVTVPGTMSYYGSGSSSSEKSATLVSDAIAAALEEGYTFKDCVNEDGHIELVYIVYAGIMQNMGGPSINVWAKASYTSEETSISGTDYTYQRYCMSSERISKYRIASIGVTCHEFSHCLGLPDLYPKDSDYKIDNQEMEYWDLMDGGEYAYNGYYPTAYLAWEKEAMGWPVKIDTLTSETKTADITTATLAGGTAYRILNENEGANGECIMLERITSSEWNEYAANKKGTEGILAYHMNYLNTEVNMSDYPNNRANPGLCVIPADGLLESYYLLDETINGVLRTNSTYMASLQGDLFNASNGLKLNDDLELPNYKWYNGGTTNKSVRFIYNSDETITLKYVHDTNALASVTTPPVAQTPTYTSEAQALVSAGEATDGVLQYSLDDKTYSTDIPTGTDAGEYTVYYMAVGDDEHYDTDPETISVSIASAPLTVTAKDMTINFNADVPEYTVRYDGFVGNDLEDVLLGELLMTCNYEKGDDSGTYDIIPGGLSSSNYNITFVNGTLTVNEAPAIATTLNAITTLTEEDHRIYSLDGRYMGTDQQQLPSGVYIINKKKVVIK